MGKKYQVFISSTYEDLQEERDKVRDAILSMYHFPVGMELFGAASEEQWEIIKETIDTSDYYVLIVGQRYGTVIPEGPDKGISYTEKEFKYAKDKGIPILAFLIDDSVPVKASHVEKKHIKEFDKFKASVKNGRTVTWWENADDLAQKVTAALHKQIERTPQQGWMRANDLLEDSNQSEFMKLYKEKQKLSEDNEKLKQQISKHIVEIDKYKEEINTLTDENKKTAASNVYKEAQLQLLKSRHEGEIKQLNDKYRKEEKKMQEKLKQFENKDSHVDIDNYERIINMMDQAYMCIQAYKTSDDVTKFYRIDDMMKALVYSAGRNKEAEYAIYLYRKCGSAIYSLKNILKCRVLKRMRLKKELHKGLLDLEEYLSVITTK
ncbi:DUF4062 domain-containing protein [Clostridiales bacterium FE2010]|nr:DUF4062 domain-containing protein [Clostridiales bacterium FE2010]